MNRIDELLDKYEERFDECFPLMLCKGMDDDTLCTVIEDCLDKGKAYAPDIDQNEDY